jgi:tRNA modification GTPase
LENETTIAAISTPSGAGGISIVRVSGDLAESVTEKIFRPEKSEYPLKSHRLYLGNIFDPQKETLLDQVLCTLMRAPATYTREDMAEFHCHGGPVIAARVLELVLSSGARLAQPGEFTRRAFMAGRIDLSQAEAVVELINARSSVESSIAAAQLTGGILEKAESIRAPLVEILAHIEVALDFPDESDEVMDWTAAARNIVEKAVAPLDELINAYQQGRAFREGVTVAIAGRPNVGKSSLLNALLKDERAIVTDLPGTTRDVIEAPSNVHGLPLTLIDTAGLSREPQDIAEAEGQKRTRMRVESADMVLMVMDLNRDLRPEDRQIYETFPQERTLVVLNKNDLPAKWSSKDGEKFLGAPSSLIISAKTGEGLQDLGAAIFKFISGGGPDVVKVPRIVPNLRHCRALEMARPAMMRASEGLEKGLPLELIAVDLREALDHIGLITGQTTPDDVLDEIFSRFCLGK